LNHLDNCAVGDAAAYLTTASEMSSRVNIFEYKHAGRICQPNNDLSGPLYGCVRFLVAGQALNNQANKPIKKMMWNIATRSDASDDFGHTIFSFADRLRRKQGASGGNDWEKIACVGKYSQYFSGS